MNSQLTHQDWEALSAYLDGQLNSHEQNRIEARMETNPALRAALEDLSRTRQILRSTPRLRVPRSFALSPEMAGIEPHRSSTFPFFRIAFALASVLFVLVFVGDLARGFPSGVAITTEAPAPVVQERAAEEVEELVVEVTQEVETALDATSQPEVAAAPVEEAVEEQEEGDAPTEAESLRPSGTQRMFMQADEAETPETEIVGTEVVVKEVAETEEMEAIVEPTEMAMEPEIGEVEAATEEEIQEAEPPSIGFLDNPLRLLEIIFASAAVLSGLGMLITRRRTRR